MSLENIQPLEELDPKEKLRKKAQKFIDERRDIWNIVTRDSSLQYVASDNFAFDHHGGKVYLSTQFWEWGEKYGLSKEQMNWAVLHEIGHFQDLRQDPNGYKQGFALNKVKAEQLSQEVLAKWEQKPNFQKNDQALETAKRFIEKKLHSFWNVLDDIYVNDGINLDFPKYGPQGSEESAVNNLYRDYLFPINQENFGTQADESTAMDLTDQPASMQMMYYLLRKKMVPGQEIKISDKVSEAIFTTSGGFKPLTLEQKVRRICRKKPYYEKNQNTSTVRRSVIVAQGIEQAFINLLMDDIQNLPPPQEQPEQNSNQDKSDQKQKQDQSDQQENNQGESGQNEKEKQGEKGDNNQNKSQKPEKQKQDKPENQDKDDSNKQGQGKPDKQAEKNQGDKSGDNPDDNQSSDKPEDQEGGGKSDGKSEDQSNDQKSKPGKGKPDSAKEGGKSDPWSDDFAKFPDFSITPEMVEKYIKGKQDFDDQQTKDKVEKEKTQQLKPEEMHNRTKEEIEKILDQMDKNPNDFTDAQKKAAKNRKNDLKICDNNNINEQIATKYRELKQEIEPHKKELADVFERMMVNINQGLKASWETGFRSGKINVDRIVKKYGSYFADENTINLLPFDELDAYDQKDYISQLTIEPEVIRVRLLIDCSGSMDEKKRHEVKKIALLMMESFEEAEDNVNARYKTRKPIQIDVQIVTYGDKASLVKDFEREQLRMYGSDQKLLDKWRTLAHLDDQMGSTYSDKAWSIVRADIKRDPDYQTKIARGKIKDFCFEITDGGADNPDQAKMIIADLNKVGLINRGIQIKPDSSDKRIFDSIWNKDISNPRGKVIEDIQDLAPFFIKTLKSELDKIQIKVQEVDD